MIILSERLMGIENMNDSLIALDSPLDIDVKKLQEKIFRGYESNPVLYDALLGRQTITQSLEELAEINKGIRRFLPHRKNKPYNERVKQMGELVPVGSNLISYGILWPDNFVTTTLETTAIAFAVSSVLLGAFGTEFKNEELILPATMSCISPLIGLAFNRSKYVPRKEAEYLDGKIRDIYGDIL